MGKRPFGLGNCGHIPSFLSDKKKRHPTRWAQKPDISGVTTPINCRKEMGLPVCLGL